LRQSPLPPPPPPPHRHGVFAVTSSCQKEEKKEVVVVEGMVLDQEVTGVNADGVRSRRRKRKEIMTMALQR